MNYNNIEKYLSAPRLNRYLRASDASKKKALQIYRTNLRLSQAFYPVLNLFETFFRNALHGEISLFFNDTDWIVNQRNHFMTDKSLAGTSFFLKKEVERAEIKIYKKSKSIHSSKVIAEQSFGFWTSFFDPHHFKIIQGVAISTFPYKPKDVNRKAIAFMLREIREFRNRVYHNEPICFKGNIVDFSQAIQIRKYILEITSWIDPKLLAVMIYYDNIMNKIPQHYHRRELICY
ncbi:Abi family protein [Sphingobacterium haloxyli]|uniref:Abi family protein n=1 Tax=Sphingobacterium haloxyli TaxID=2100533 RepID=UPI0013FD41D2|nr:Abi family protein [Sphingobacterium haloxyli]